MEPIAEMVPPPSRLWAALPPDLVGEISVRLRDDADFVRFHAVCGPWREAAPSRAANRPRFLPWPLASCNDLLLHLPLNFGRISSPWPPSRHGRGREHGVLLRRVSSSADKNWVASADGTAAWFLRVRAAETTMVDLLTGAISVLPRFPQNGFSESKIKMRMEKSRGIVYSDGTIFLYNVEGGTFTAAVLRPGDVAWTIAEKSPCFVESDHMSAAYHDGKILVLMYWQYCFVLTPDFMGNGGAGGGMVETMNVAGDGMKHEGCYIFKSGNELMWATVMSKRNRNNSGCAAGYHPSSTPSVTLRALVGVSGGGEMRWVGRDVQSLRDRVLFLGSPASFTVNAAHLGVRGGCAYFVFERCVFRYDLINGVAELMGRARSGWGSDKAHVWLYPHLAIAPIQEIKERLEALRNKSKSNK